MLIVPAPLPPISLESLQQTLPAPAIIISDTDEEELLEVDEAIPVVVRKPREPTLPPQDCILLPRAQRLVTELVAAEVELLTQNITAHSAQAVEEAARTISAAAGDATLTALRSFLEESTELSAKLVAEAEGLTARAAEIASATAAASSPRGAARNKRSSSMTTHADSVIPELDFALVSAGSQVVVAQTSATYFPEQWRLDRTVTNALASAGLSGISLPTDWNAPAAVHQLYEALSLHKTVGVPEDALEPTTRPGACWPMEVTYSYFYKARNMCISICDTRFI